MNADQVINLIGQVITVATKAMELGADVKPFAEAIYNDLVNKKTISQSDLAALRKKIAELEARALSPVPPAEPDELLLGMLQ